VQELGGSTARQPAQLASGNIPYHEHHGQLGLARGQESFFSHFCEFKSTHVEVRTILGV